MKLLTIISFLFFFNSVIAQTPTQTQPEQKNIQATIMVIPFAAKGVQLRDAYERSELVRIAVTKVKEGFDSRNVNTIDLRGKLKQSATTSALETEQTANDKDDIIRNSGADIYVEVEANKNASTSGNSVTIIMTAFDAFSGESFANKVATSKKFITEDYSKLAEKAVETEIDNFLNTINTKFDDIVNNGRTIVLNLGIEDGSKFNFETEVGKDRDLLSDAIENWVEANAFKKYYHIQGITNTKMIFDQVKVPLKDENGNNFKLTRFARDFKKYLENVNLTTSTTYNGNNLVITIKQMQ